MVGSSWMKGFWSVCYLMVVVFHLVTPLIEFSRDPNDIHFYLYPFSQQPDTNQEILFNNTSSLVGSLFQPNQKTVFIIHGFRSNVSNEFPQETKNTYLESDLNYNYIIVSWGALSTPGPPSITSDLYFLAVGNVPIVARRVADFIKFLMGNNYLTLDKIHMIGHSLGAHVSGLTGRHLQQELDKNVSRITGLDPAGPLFPPGPVPTRERHSSPSSSSRKLIPSDADFVDVIHSNAGILGDQSKDGHADFWPNGGTSQPKCAANDTGLPPFGMIGYTGVCSHRFSYKLYNASFKKDLTACNCAYVSIVLQTCPMDCPEADRVLMGQNCPTTAIGNFYIRTTNPP